MTDSSGAPTTGAIPIGAERPTWFETLRALKVPNFRRYAIGQLASTVAVWTQRIAQDWLVLELTGSVTVVGFMVLMQFGPVLLLGMWGGVIVDRYQKRVMIIFAQTAMGVIAAALAVLAFTGTVRVWQVFVLAGILGLVAVIDQPARQVFVSELVERVDLPNAISTNSAIFQTGGMIGPAISGALIVLAGNAWAFTASAAGSVISLVMLLLIDSTALQRNSLTPRAKGQVVEAFRYARNKSVIFWTLLLIFFVSIMGLNWPVLLAAMANEVFRSGAAGYGLYNSAVAVGALVGAILSMRRKSVRLRTIVTWVVFAASLKLSAGLAPYEFVFLLLLAGAGMSLVLMWTAANALLQLSSNVHIRGRVMSLYLLIALGGQAIGGPILGIVCEHFGARTGMLISGSVPLIAGIVIATGLAHSRKLKIRFSLRRGDPMLQIVER